MRRILILAVLLLVAGLIVPEADVANPTLIPEFAPGKDWNDVIVPNGADLDGTGDFVSTPAPAVATDLEVRFQITLTDATPAAEEVIAGEWDETADERAWKVAITTDGKIKFYHSSDGTAGTVETATDSNAAFSDGVTAWAAVSFDADNGSTWIVKIYKFFNVAQSGVHTSPADLADWGAPNTVASDHADNIFDGGTAALAVGADSEGNAEFTGQIHEIQVWSNMKADGGSLLANPRFHDSSVWTIGDTGSGLDSQGNTWTLNADAVIAGSWINISSDVRPPYRIREGRQTPFTRMRPSTLTFRLGDSSGDYDPENTGGAYTGQLVPLVPVRWRLKQNGVIYNRWRGFIMNWNVEAPGKVGDTFTDVRAVDALTVFQLHGLDSAWDDVVQRLTPKAWYRLNERSGSTIAVDSSGNGHHGVWEGTPTVVTSGGPPIVGDPGTYADLDGVDDRVVLPESAAFRDTQAFSMVAWFLSPANEGAYMYYQTIRDSGATADTASLYVSRSFENQQVISDCLGPAGSGIASSLQSTTEYDDGEWHLAAMTYDGALEWKLYVDNVEKSTTTETGALVLPPTGSEVYAAGFVNTFYEPGDVRELVLFDSELSVTDLADLWNSSKGWPDSLTSQRVTDLLDLLGWPVNDRNISTGTSTMGAITTVSSYLAGLQQAQDTEDGELFVDGEGLLVFTNRYDRDVSAHAAVFSNDGSDTPYAMVKPVRNKNLLRNVARITDSDGATYEARDTASTTAYAPRVLSRTTQTTTVGEPQDYADALAAEFGSSRTTLKLWLIHGRDISDATWAEMLSRRLGDLVSVEVSPIHGGAQVQHDMFVEEMITTGKGAAGMEMIIGLSPAQNSRMFTLDDDVLGELDGDNEGLLGW